MLTNSKNSGASALSMAGLYICVAVLIIFVVSFVIEYHEISKLSSSGKIVSIEFRSGGGRMVGRVATYTSPAYVVTIEGGNYEAVSVETARKLKIGDFYRIGEK